VAADPDGAALIAKVETGAKLLAFGNAMDRDAAIASWRAAEELTVASMKKDVNASYELPSAAVLAGTRGAVLWLGTQAVAQDAELPGALLTRGKGTQGLWMPPDGMATLEYSKWLNKLFSQLASAGLFVQTRNANPPPIRVPPMEKEQKFDKCPTYRPSAAFEAVLDAVVAHASDDWAVTPFDKLVRNMGGKKVAAPDPAPPAASGSKRTHDEAAATDAAPAEAAADEPPAQVQATEAQA
jgi:hypothetical protein